jgi:hypothetical protein
LLKSSSNLSFRFPFVQVPNVFNKEIDITKMKNPQVIIGDQWKIKKDLAKIRIKSLDIIVVVFENG